MCAIVSVDTPGNLCPVSHSLDLLVGKGLTSEPFGCFGDWEGQNGVQIA